ncbi:LolA-like outer membrane lipoprotein chaperone [Helicobacter fennelliae]|nr:LolA-like outer membrane lipoprotein chaperone [Helicobacter fennelliae]
MMYKILVFILSINLLYGFGENIKSIEADFTQQTKSQDSTLTYKGHFYAKSNSKAKWIYTAPTHKEIYINDTLTIVYEPLLEQATIGKSRNNIDFLHILQQAKQIDKQTYNTTFENTTYTLTTKDNLPYTLEFHDEFDNQITITFSHIQINQTMQDEIFTFVPPPHIDIIQ